MEWRFENTGHRTGVFNMEYDEGLACSLKEGKGKPTVRVYGWHPPAISLGWNQSIEQIDRQAAAHSGVDIVRRPTGGRAILHSNELTYSVVMPNQGKSILEVYERISCALVAALDRIGVLATLEKTQPDFPSLYRTSSASACFSSAGRYELKHNGKKLVGSAQRRYTADRGEVVLQHGSILLGPEHKQIIDFLCMPSEEDRQKLRLELDEKTTELSSILSRVVQFEEMVQAVHYGFESAWKIEFQVESHFHNKQKVVA